MADTVPDTVAETVDPTVSATVPDPAEVREPDDSVLSGLDLSSLLSKPAEETPAAEKEEAEPAAETVDGDAKGDDEDEEAAAEPEEEEDDDEGLVEGDPDPAPPAEAPATPAAPDPKAQEAQQQAFERYTAWDKSFSELAETFEKDVDLLENPDTAAKAIKILLQGQKYARDAIVTMSDQLASAGAEKQESAAWEQWSAGAGIPADRGRKVFAEEIAKAEKEFPGLNADGIRAVATVKLNARAKLIAKKAQAAAPATPPPAKPKPAAAAKAPTPPGVRKPPVTAGGGRVASGAAGGRVAPAKSKDPYDNLADRIGGFMADFGS